MKRTYTMNNRTFDCYINPLGKALIEVSVWEVVRPNWIIFRRKYMDTRSFFDTDYPSITLGVIAMIDKCIESEREEKARRAKWEEFEGR